MKATIRVSLAGGATADVEIENGTSIKEIFEALGELGFSAGDKVSVNGESVEPEYTPEEGDVVTAHKTPEGA